MILYITYVKILTLNLYLSLVKIKKIRLLSITKIKLRGRKIE